MCGMHYRRWLDHTQPDERPIAPRFQREFWDSVSKRHEQGCWIWTGPRDKKGYGRWGKSVASRFSWEIAHGAIPDGMWVLHHCDNPPCVNPGHLYIGTVVENVQDMVDRGRAYRPEQREACSKGHLKIGENLIVVRDRDRKSRRCRICENERSAANQRKRRRVRGLMKTRVSDQERADILELRRSGETHRSIAVKMGRALATVQGILKAERL
jgi:hypothetical protein